MTARARAQFIITEFIADNNTSLIDEVGENPDWVEIYNEGAAAASPADLT